jgi:PAS domain S-box-containing protein
MHDYTLRKVLLVEDEAVTALSTKRSLERQGYEVVIAADAESAITVVECDPHIDLVVMDIDIGPGKSGAEAAQEIAGIRRVPIMFLSPHTEREHVTEKRLEESLRWIRALFDGSPSGIILADSFNKIIEANEMSERLLGYEPGELVGLNARDLIPEEELERTPPEDVTRKIVEERELFTIENRFRCKDGSLIDVSVRSRKIEMEDHPATHIVEFQDISRRKEAERRAEALVKEKELLIREIHHRVKNDINFVRSLLSLQATTSTNQELRSALREAVNRVTVMSHVYERLYLHGDYQRVEAGHLVENLVKELGESTIPVGVHLGTDCGECLVPTRTAVALGIVANELVTNAAKHAFSELEGGAISVSLTSGAPEEVILQVRDNGSGIPDQVMCDGGYGFGLTVVTALVEQHDGEISMWNEEGGVVEVRLPATCAD